MTDGHLDRIDEVEEEEDDGDEAVETAADVETETAAENGGDNVSKLIQLVNPTESAAVLEAVAIAPAEVTHPFCVICTDYILPGLTSLQPCPCGYYVHSSCLLRGIQTYEADHPGCLPLGCRFCNTRYNITPRKSWAFRVLEKSSSLYRRFCDVGCHVMPVVLVDTAFTVAGIGLLYKLYGQNEAENMLLTMDSVLAVAVCKAIPLISIGINSIPWEVKLLRLYRRYMVRSSPATPVHPGTSAELYPQAPAQASAQAPAQTPTQAPTKTPAQAPVQIPAEAPAQTPAEAPAQTPAQAPAQTPAQAPAQTPAQAPAQSPAEDPAQAPAEAPAQTPAYASAQSPAQSPAEDPAQAPAHASAQSPAQSPAEDPAQAPAEAPSQAPAQSPAEDPAQAHAQAPVREAKYKRTLLGTLIGGLMLPWYGVWVGNKVFWAVSSPVLRFVLGGLSFVVVKGALKMYYRQKLYERQCSLRVASYRGD